MAHLGPLILNNPWSIFKIKPCHCNFTFVTFSTMSPKPNFFPVNLFMKHSYLKQLSLEYRFQNCFRFSHPFFCSKEKWNAHEKHNSGTKRQMSKTKTVLKSIYSKGSFYRYVYFINQLTGKKVRFLTRNTESHKSNIAMVELVLKFWRLK